MKRDLLRNADRVMLIFVLSLLCVLSSVTAGLSQCKCTLTITGASVHDASNKQSCYEFTGICTFTPSSGGETCPGPKQITGKGCWFPDEHCPDSGTFGTATESMRYVGGSSIFSISSFCPKNPWLNDNVQCGPSSPPQLPACLKAMTTFPVTAALLTSAQKQVLTQQEQAKYVIIPSKPLILSPTEGQTVWVTHLVPIKVKYCPSFGNLGFQFQWRANTNESWHDENINVPYTTSNTIATANLNLNKPGLWQFRASAHNTWSDWRGFRIIEPPKPSTPPPGTVQQKKPPINK
jgi:hypothetical protein